ARPNAVSRKANGAENATEKKIIVSSAEDTRDENSGACHQALLRSRSKIAISRNCARRNAVPDAMAIRGVASQIDNTTATAKPQTTTRRARCGPRCRFVRSVTRNATG